MANKSKNSRKQGTKPYHTQWQGKQGARLNKGKQGRRKVRMKEKGKTERNIK